MSSENQFAVLLAIAGLAGGGLLSWLFTFIYFKKSRVRKFLCYAFAETHYLGDPRADFHGLSVHYGERQLKYPYRYSLYIWNGGNVTIDGSDLSPIDPLGFGRNDIEIIEATASRSTRDSINIRAAIDTSKQKLSFTFDFLDPDDGFAVEFLVDRKDVEQWWRTDLQPYGTIKGLHRVPFRVPLSFKKASWWPKLIGIAAIIFFLLSAIAMAYDAWMSGMVVTSLVKLLASIIFGIISIALIAVVTGENGSSNSYAVPFLLKKNTRDVTDELDQAEKNIHYLSRLHLDPE